MTFSLHQGGVVMSSQITHKKSLTYTPCMLFKKSVWTIILAIPDTFVSILSLTSPWRMCLIILCAVLFQLNFFEDHTKLILCPLMGAVTYIDRQRNFRTFKLSLIQQVGSLFFGWGWLFCVNMALLSVCFNCTVTLWECMLSAARLLSCSCGARWSNALPSYECSTLPRY